MVLWLVLKALTTGPVLVTAALLVGLQLTGLVDVVGFAGNLLDSLLNTYLDLPSWI